MKMGIVLVAQNNGCYDYEELAQAAGKRASNVMGLPYVVVRGESSNSDYRKYPGGETGNFKNNRQVAAMMRTPYEVSIFIDADFIVNTDALAVEAETLAAKNLDVMFLTNANITFVDVKPENTSDLWSTVLIYKKGAPVLNFFDDVLAYGANWDYAKVVNRIPSGMLYRNDIAFSLAKKENYHMTMDNLSEGYQCQFTTQPYSPKAQLIAGARTQLDVHAMHKGSLFEAMPW